jgi:hypothetical protein
MKLRPVSLNNSAAVGSYPGYGIFYFAAGL